MHVDMDVNPNRLVWPHRRRGLPSDGVRYAGAQSSVGRRFRSVTKLRLEWHEGVFLSLQQRSKHPRDMVITLKASTSLVWSPLLRRPRPRRNSQRCPPRRMGRRYYSRTTPMTRSFSTGGSNWCCAATRAMRWGLEC